MHTRAFLATQENYNKGRLPHPRALCVPILRAIVENLNRPAEMGTFEPLIRRWGLCSKDWNIQLELVLLQRVFVRVIANPIPCYERDFTWSWTFLSPWPLAQITLRYEFGADQCAKKQIFHLIIGLVFSDRIKVSQVTIIGSNFARLGECSHNFRSSSTFSRVEIPGKISTISFFRVSLFFLITALYTKSKNCRFLLYNAIWGSRSAKREVESCFWWRVQCVCVRSLLHQARHYNWAPLKSYWLKI